MTVNSCCSCLFLLLFLVSDCSVRNIFQESSHHICSPPYSCLITRECAERHSPQGTDEVLFKCGELERVCCPPIKSRFSEVSPESKIPNHSPMQTTTERGVIRGCTQCPFETNRPQSIAIGEYPAKKETHGYISSQGQSWDQNIVGSGQHVHGVSSNFQIQPIVTGRPVQSESAGSRRSSQTQPQEGRRPPQSRPQKAKPFPQSLQLSSHKNFRLLPSESHCGVNNFANRITEGEEVSLGEYPWMVLTGLKDKYGNYRWNCGGTLISGWYILTAAHCLIVDNRTIEYVRLGEHSLTNETDCCRDVCLDPPEDIAIAEVIPHERWNTTSIKNDIALLRLSRNALELGKSNIYPICLPFEIDKLNITPSTKYEVAGWGKTDWNSEEGSDVLRKASISGVNREECNICKDNKKQQYCPIIDTQLCVQGWKSVDVCKGDSGGPLMITRLNIYQIGITSFKGSEYCGAENIPSIFTKVESFLPWILDNIRQ